MHELPPIIVFSHLRWDWVYQRPQHLLSRLARERRIIVIEEPLRIEDGSPAHWTYSEPEPNVLRCIPHTSVAEGGFSDPQMPVLRHMLEELIQREELREKEYVVWFYTPMALPLGQCLDPAAVVFDCMDELSAFKFAPPQLLEREAELFTLADVVFTGGPSLYRAKKDRHSNVHCFPSSVDRAHFSKGQDGGKEPADQAQLPHPRLGFYGVIDERIDLETLDVMARAHPEWQICMVGPIIKIDPANLPRHPNLHYFGQRQYADLPGYLTGWDVCILPFALNDATRFISPTKTLEYMAAEKQIVSTPITDVAVPYGHIVHLGDTPEAFIAACERALAETPEQLAARVQEMRAVLQQTSWDATARAMAGEIWKIIDGRKSLTGPSIPVAARQDDKWPTVVVGAGPTGLSAAYHLGPQALLLERNDRVGGWCRSLQDKGFTFDFAGHIMFSKEEYVHEMYKMLLGDNVHWQDREAWIFSKGVYTRYPFQGALYGLPPEVIKECIMGAIEARFGPLKNKSEQAKGPAPNTGSNGHDHKKDECRVGDVKDCCGDGVLESTARLVRAHNGDRQAAGHNGHNGDGHNGDGSPANFEEFIYKVWGAGIAKHFAIPYNRKLWAVPLTEMETSWLGGRVPMPDLEEMIEGALRPVPKPMGPNARFGYPLRGGFQALMDGFLPHIKEQLRLNTGVRAVSPGEHTLTLSDGSTVRYDYLISTMPLPVLIRSMGEEAPPHIRKAAAGLRYVSVRCVNIGVGRENLTEKHWIYYPDDTVFHRIFVQGNASPYCNPPGGFGLTCEITYSPSKPLPCDGDELIQRCISDCHKVGFFKPEDPIWAANQVDMPHAYVVYDHARARNVKVIRDWLLKHDIVLAGRYSEWEYYNSDHAFVAGKKAAEQVHDLRTARAARRTLVAR